MSHLHQALILKKLLLRNSKHKRLFGAWMALFIGCLLLLVSVMIWSTFQDLLKGKTSEDSLGSTFLTISKKVDDASMADKKKTQINDQDVAQIKKAAQVQDLGLLTPANFKVSASLGSGPMSFYTLLFLEAAPDRFMDQMPKTWQWQEGDHTVPIILSRDFLNMYNYVFAPSQGLPLLSEQTVKAIGFTITIGEGASQVNYRAQVEGFSDRISSVLVPQSFIDYGNKHYSQESEPNISRVIIKVNDPSDNAFVSFLEKNNYTTNTEQLRYSKMRSVVSVVSSATGLLAFLLMGIGSLVFILFIELTMAQAQQSVKLLLQLGYSPKKLSAFLLKKYIPILISALLSASLLAILIQYFTAQKMSSLPVEISSFPSLYVWIAASISAGILLLQMVQSIRKAINP